METIRPTTTQPMVSMQKYLLAPLLLAASPLWANVPNLVADIPATGSLAQQVLGDLGQVRVLLPTGGDAHHHQLRPSDAAALQDADLLVWIGPELTPWLERASSGIATGETLELLELPETELRAYGTEAEHGHDHDHSHEEEHAHEGHDHDHDGTDPHAWLDPQNGRIWLTAIANKLAAADPENAATYARNAQAGIARIDTAEAKISASLSPVLDRPFVVSHDAYGYFTDHFSLPAAIAISLGDAAAPSAARLSALRDQLQDAGAVCAFPEAGHDPALMISVTENSGIRLGKALDPAGVDQQRGADLYPKLLQGLGQTIADCLSQGS